jgi:hypothetical protein
VSPLELRPQTPGRCAFCHDDLDGATATCPSCKTVLHQDCREHLGLCPTLGCRESRFTLLPGATLARPVRRRPAFERALANMAARAAETEATAVPTLRALPPPRPGARPTRGERCAICYGLIARERWSCAGCRAAVHAQCRHLGCGTRNCRGALEPPPGWTPTGENPAG